MVMSSNCLSWVQIQVGGVKFNSNEWLDNISVLFIFKDGPTLVSFYISFCLFMWKIIEDSKIQTRIVRVKGKETDHKTTTTVLNSVLFKILSILAGVAVGAAGEVY